MLITTLDIETLTPDWTPPKGQEDKFPPLPYHVPCVICWMVFDTKDMGIELNIYRLAESRPETREADALGALANTLQASTRIVTFNGRGFDMPLLGLRAMKHGVNWHFWHGQRHRYENYKKALVHYDMQDQLGDQGGAYNIGLDGVCQLLGFPGKFDMHGSEVGKVWGEDPDRVVKYCVEDVWHTWLIYLQYLHTFRCGEMGQHRDMSYGWEKASMAWAQQTPELKRWVDEWSPKKDTDVPLGGQDSLPF